MKKPSLGFIICLCFLLGGPLLIYLSAGIYSQFFSPWAKLPKSATNIVTNYNFKVTVVKNILMKARLSRESYLFYVEKEGYTMGTQTDYEQRYNKIVVTDNLVGPSWWNPPKKPELVAYKEYKEGMAVVIFKDGWLYYERGVRG